MFSKTFEITKRASLLAAAVTLTALLGAQSAQAQEFPASEQNQKIQKKVSVERTYNAPIPLTDAVKKQMKPGIRYTVGSVKESGWQHGLVKGNRNLGHYYWAPMNHMVQGSASDRTKVQYIKAEQKQRTFHYIKPIHAANPANPHTLTGQQAVAKKIRYIHQNVPVNKHVAASVRFPRNQENVNGQLVSKATQAKVYADYSGKSASAASTTGYLTNKDAYGKILND